MAGSAPVVEKPKLGRAATITGFVFVLLILTGFSAATAVSYEDKVGEYYSSDDHGDDHADDDHSDDHADDDHSDDHADDDHADEDHGDDDHSDE